MADQPSERLSPLQHADTGPASRIGILTGSDGSLGVSVMLLDVAGLAAVEARSVTELQALVRGGGVAAVVMDPELGDGWPVDVAEQAAGAMGEQVPVVLLCRHAHDAHVIQQRVSSTTVAVLVSGQFHADQLKSIIKGAIAVHRARSGSITLS